MYALLGEASNNKNALITNLQKELSWVGMVGGENPKNYQIWHHRRALLEKLMEEAKASIAMTSLSSSTGGGDPLTAPASPSSSSSDPEIQQVGKAELEYLTTVIDVDGKNYHAWSHRQWVVSYVLTSAKNDVENNTVWQREMEYTAQLLEEDIRNNSAWNHRWFALHHGAVAGRTKNKRVLSLEI